MASNPKRGAAPAKLPLYKDWFLLQLAALVFLVDQFTKYLVREFLPFGASIPSQGFFRVTHIFNTGSAFGLFQNQNDALILVSFVGIGVLTYIYISQSRPDLLLRLSLGLQLGGALGNLLDRLRLGHVTDFIDVGPWPVFNLADSSIIIGLLILAWLFLKPQPKPAPAAEMEAEPPPPAVAIYPCPVCEGEMRLTAGSWRCLDCGVGERYTPAPSARALASAPPPAFEDSLSTCPVCGGTMLPHRQGWRCGACGVRETLAPPVPVAPAPVVSPEPPPQAELPPPLAIETGPGAGKISAPEAANARAD